ncbi:extracellular catalytic domain type 1 short-chain-length polyhydroxyalkanoate depolymerase [Nocardia arthritidis]|uniref:Esterase n=1 Tax=Nocardia arthritidis TaxID=228602 RepID=A0A6G9YFW5_9NOCA|nr:PHB depolymerase family esterase [Nocardia arthritidis]QIS12111.1 esterase [Nocardia arthritidis]
MPRTLVAVVLCAVIACTVACGRSAARTPGDPTLDLNVGGTQRHYLIHRPAAPRLGRIPAVLVFHGGGGTARYMADRSGFDRLADDSGFLAVYPDGIDKSWNDGRGGDTRAGALGVDDVGFVSSLIDRLVADENVDPARIFATGMSNGAMFTEDLGCRLSAKLAAIAPVAGTLPAADAPDCAPTHPLPVLEIHGTADPVVPYQGGVVRVTSGNLGGSGSSPVLSTDATQQLWRAKNGCGQPDTANLPSRTDDGTSVTTYTAACAGGTSVVLYSVTGGGHSWPGGQQYLPAALIGPVSHQFDATETIWRFFAAVHP